VVLGSEESPTGNPGESLVERSQCPAIPPTSSTLRMARTIGIEVMPTLLAFADEASTRPRLGKQRSRKSARLDQANLASRSSYWHSPWCSPSIATLVLTTVLPAMEPLDRMVAE
jgi:hypothetical protein